VGFYGATLRNIHVAPNKMRLVVDQIRGERVERAREILRFSAKRAAYYVDRVLLSALGNADVRSDGHVGAGELYVAEAYCDAGAQLRRLKAGPMGRGRPIRRRTCHITVVLGVMGAEEEEEQEAEQEEQPTGS
jgi:large subunit ribosomal protein L22